MIFWTHIGLGWWRGHITLLMSSKRRSTEKPCKYKRVRGSPVMVGRDRGITIMIALLVALTGAPNYSTVGAPPLQGDAVLIETWY